MSYIDRLTELNLWLLWLLEDKRNVADLMELFHTCHGMYEIKRQNLFEKSDELQKPNNLDAC